MARNNKKVVEEPQEEVVEEKPKRQRKAKEAEPEESEHEEPETRRKKTRRQEISNSGIRRILLSEAQTAVYVPRRRRRPAAGKPSKAAVPKRRERRDIRVSSKAISAAFRSTVSFLNALRVEVSNRLKLADKKTVTEELIIDIFEGHNGVSPLVNLNIRSRDIMTERIRNIALTGVMKLFRNGKEFIITSNAKKYILNATVSFLTSMGRDSAIVMRQARRATISEKDIATVCAIKYTV